MEWYFVSAQAEQNGPVSQDQLKAAYQAGKTNKDCLCWNETMSGWTLIKDVPGLLAYLSPALPSPTSPSRQAANAQNNAAAMGQAFLQQQQAKQAAQAASGAAWIAQREAESESARRAEAERLEKQRAELASARQKREAEEAAKKREEEAAKAREDARKKQEQHKAQQQQVWIELRTADGLPYYHNRVTNEVTWEKPNILREAHELDQGGEWVWLPEPEEGFVKARLVEKYSDGRFKVETEQGRQMIMKKGTVLDHLQMSSLRKLERDLVVLDEMNKPLIIHNLRERFRQNEIYTNVGTILISLNPYKRLPLYTPTIIDEYRTRGQKSLPPHVFVIADDAYTNLIEKSQGQSVIISGESGSGKTECTKQCLQYLAEVAGSSNNIEQKILVANPILEAFGNAKTVRNNNSSRFGKYVEIFFDTRNQISGARTTNYLLEKSRVVFQQEGERNYHIFYNLCAAPEATRKKYQLRGAETFGYLRGGGDIHISGVNDAEDFMEVQSSFEKLEMKPEERDRWFQVTAAVLHLGDVNFRSTGEKKVAVEDKAPLQIAAKLFEVPLATLEMAVISRTLKMKGDKPIEVSLSKIEAEAARDALAKFVYAKLFDWLVIRINKAIGLGSSPKGKSIGILDIFGFEIFKVNSFEQLCINYANEKLQQLFNNNTFKLEEAVYRQEKIDFKHIEYADNQPVLDLIDKKPNGILVLVDEELRMPKGSDSTFVQKLHVKHKETPQLGSIVSAPEHFLVKHYAGDVVYDSKDFLLKNQDKMGDDAFDCITSSSLDFLTSMFKGELKDDRKAAQDRAKTLGSKFADQLGELMNSLGATEPHYIRCVKPNPDKAPLMFCGGMVLEQLTYSGVFEAVEIRKRGFPFRYSHQEFYKRFKCLAPKKKWPSAQKACEELIAMMGETKEVRIGVSRVLYRATQHKNMELQRNLAVEKTAKYLQKVIRGYQARKLSKQLKVVKPICVQAIKTRSIEACDKALEACSGLSFPLKEWEEVKKLKARLVEEKRVSDALTVLLAKNPEDPTVEEELSKTIASADEISLDTPLAKKARELLIEVKDRRKCRKWLEEGVQQADETKLDWALARAAELKLSASKEIKAAQDMKQRIIKERQVGETLVKAASTGGYLKEGDVITTDALEAALNECQKFDMKTEQGKKLIRLYSLLLDLRNRLKSALGTKDKALWKVVEQIVIKAGEEFENNEEVVAARGEVSRQAAVEEIAARLEQAVAALDQETLQYGLNQAKQLQIDEHKYPVVPVAREYLERIVTCRQLLQSAQNPPEEKELIYAIQYAESFGYDTEEVKKVRVLRDTVLQINVEAKYALEMLEDDELKDLHTRAEKVNLLTPEIERIRTLLFSTAEEKFVQLQLKAAVKNEDPARVTRVTIRLKDLFFKKAGPMFKFENFPKLRSPNAWAGLKLLTLSREALAAGMRKFQRSPIHASLTEMGAKQNKIATRMFRNIMGFMGDRAYESPLLLVEELLTKALENDWLRDEIYCQLIKQVSGNPSEESSTKGWQLMACCLETFPPQSEFENYLEMFLRAHAKPAERFIRILHATVYGGPRAVAPNQAELTRIINGETLRKHAFDKKREYKRPVAQIPAKAPIGAPPSKEEVYRQLAASSGEAPIKATDAPGSTPTLGPTPASYSDPVLTSAGPSLSAVIAASSAPAAAPEAAAASPAGDWQTAYHPQTGAPYYYNIRTGEVTWDKPAEL